jgi:hypothetical protein
MFKSLDLWLPAYLRRTRLRHAKEEPVHLLIAVCDHFEPFHGVGKKEALERVNTWREQFPKLAAGFADSGGQAPRQTFFYPVEQYDPDIVSGIAELCRASACEVEVHLHHRDDTAENLRATLEQGKRDLLEHGFLSKDAQGAVGYGFIHGNWALNNSHPEGKGCGVDNELPILRETGCYADFTMPSAPHPTQTRTINSLYYALETGHPKCHDRGIPARAEVEPPENGFLMVQGPLGLNWRWRKWGALPRLENGDLTGANPPTLNRLLLWKDLGIHVEGRPDWLFVKLHTHGGIPRNYGMLLGEPMWRFHRSLAGLAKADPDFHYHYVSAREMVNILHAAEAGKSGNPSQYRDFRFRSNIARS